MANMRYIILVALSSLAFIADAKPVSILGYTFDDSAENVFEGIIVEYANDYPNGVGDGALDVITSGGVELFEIDTNNPSNVDASVVGFLDTNDSEIATPASISFDVHDDNDNIIGTLLAGTLTHISGNNYNFTVTGGDASAFFTGGNFVYDPTIANGDFVNDAFTLTMTASPENVNLVTILGYTFNDSGENIFEGIIVEYANDYPNGVGDGALDVIMSGGVKLFEIDTNNPAQVDAGVVGFLDNNDDEIATPGSISFDVHDVNDNIIGKLLAGTLTHVSGNNYNFTVTGGDASAYFTGGIFVYDPTIVNGDFVNDAFTLTMTASPVSDTTAVNIMPWLPLLLE